MNKEMLMEEEFEDEMEEDEEEDFNFSEIMLNEFISELLKNKAEREWVLQAYKDAKTRAYKLIFNIDEEEYKKITANDGTSAKAVKE